MSAAGIEQPFRMTAAIADGAQIHGLRYSSDRRSPTLYYATGGAIEVRDRRVEFTPGDDATLVLSEPLDEKQDDWIEIAEAHLLHAVGGRAEVRPFEPD